MYRSFPWKYTASTLAGPKAAKPRLLPAAPAAVSDSVPGRPPLRLLETRWVYKGEIPPLSHRKAVEPLTAAVAGNSADKQTGVEKVWLLAARTDVSCEALSDVILGVGGSVRSPEGDSRAPKGMGEWRRGNIIHPLTLGPTAVGGETAANDRLIR